MSPAKLLALGYFFFYWKCKKHLIPTLISLLQALTIYVFYCNISLYTLRSQFLLLYLSQTSFGLYLHNQWTDFHKLSCAGKPQMRAIHTYVGCTKATTNDWDIRPSVAVKASSANISWKAERICTVKLALESAHQSVSNDIWCAPKQ